MRCRVAWWSPFASSALGGKTADPPCSVHPGSHTSADMHTGILLASRLAARALVILGSAATAQMVPRMTRVQVVTHNDEIEGRLIAADSLTLRLTIGNRDRTFRRAEV